ncbi:MAG TPA: hypothetical protein PK820_13505 [Candidatus Competibacteraceae bacterium]|nr:hypothetical protein [Candidatus Competibacteraceae bacterium]MCP5133129.1 hypothetical protein [Gammaproteobacteria bacterium]HPF59792.1 hypothetical protein [Candidatus Competibacteraceae bacterium]
MTELESAHLQLLARTAARQGNWDRVEQLPQEAAPDRAPAYLQRPSRQGKERPS